MRVRGYQVLDTSPDGVLCTLYAVARNGDVFVSNQHKHDTLFDRKSRTWTPSDVLPGSAVYIGNYDFSKAHIGENP